MAVVTLYRRVIAKGISPEVGKGDNGSQSTRGERYISLFKERSY